jgi:2'-5' RNA ligase
MSINEGKMTTKRIQIVFTLDNKISEKIIKLNQECRAKLDGEFYIDGKNFFPHITIYSAEFPIANLITIKNSLKIIAHDIQSFKIETSKLYESDGTLMWGFKNEKIINTIHRDILQLMNPYRNGYLRKKYSDKQYLNTLSKRQIVLVKKYGYQYVLDYYKPHITFMIYEDENKAKKVLKDIKLLDAYKNPISIEIKKVGIFETGDNGTCIKKICEYSLK